MNTIELGKKLREMYMGAPADRRVTFIHLFGIKYSNEIRIAGIRAVVEESGIPISYVAEVNKGINLSDYVTAN